MNKYLDEESERFLVDYEADLLRINNDYPEGIIDRVHALNKLRQQGVHRLKGLVTKFGNPNEGNYSKKRRR